MDIENRLKEICATLQNKKEALLESLNHDSQISFSNDSGDKIIAINELLNYFNIILNEKWFLYPDDRKPILETLESELEHRVHSLLQRHNLKTNIANREFVRLIIPILEKYNGAFSIPDYVKKPLTTTSNL